MRIARVSLLGLAVLLLPALASAASLQKGSSLLALQLSRGVADLTYDDQIGRNEALARNEVGVQGQFWYFLANEYATTVSGGIGYFKESDTADPAVFGSQDVSLTVSSWKIRVGGDRFAKVTDKLQIFAGPGIHIWGGKQKTKTPVGSIEDPSTTRFAVDGRIGANLMIGENIGLIGHVGQYWGYATATNEGAETKWLPSGSEGAMGFSFGF